MTKAKQCCIQHALTVSSDIFIIRKSQTPTTRNESKVIHQQPIIFDGFRRNGLQIRKQRHFLHIVICVEIYFDAFWEISTLPMVSMTFVAFGDW